MESGEDEAALPPRFPGGRPRLCPPGDGGRGRRRRHIRPSALALRPEHLALTRSPPAGARRPGHRRAPALPPPAPGGDPRDGKRRRRGGQPRSRGRSGRRGPRPRAARDGCAALVRGEGQLEGAAGARAALASARAGAPGRERAGACMTGPGVPPGDGVQAEGTRGVHPRGVTVYAVIWGCVSVRQRQIRRT